MALHFPLRSGAATAGALPYAWTYVVSIERGAEGVLSIGIDVEMSAGGGGG
jgi:hypothetical protein